MNKKLNKKIGRIGEEIAENFLIEKDFEIVELNYQQKWGEIDIIAKKRGCWHFVEVKTRKVNPNYAFYNFIPEQQITKYKLKKLKQCALAFANYNKIENYQIDIIAIDLDLDNKILDIRFYENI